MNIKNIYLIRKASKVLSESNSILFVTSLLRAREIKMANALRDNGWKVVLIYKSTTPFSPESHFDIAIQAKTDSLAHSYAMMVEPRLTHVFSGAIDDLILLLCKNKPSPIVVDLNDVFCPALFNYLEDRFEPTKLCLESADAICSRDLQIKYAQKIDKYNLTKNLILFPEYSTKNFREVIEKNRTLKNKRSDEVHVVSVGTFCIEKNGMNDSGYLKIAKLFIKNKIHFHIYPHWFYKESQRSIFNANVNIDLSDYFDLQKKSEYIHIHESLHFSALADELVTYDFGLVSGGSNELGQELNALKENYMNACYSGRISDYIDAGLPVLINSEVKFNTWILKRYGIYYELKDILKDGFKENLIRIKQDASLEVNNELASEKLSIKNNIARLISIYNKVILNSPEYKIKFGLKWHLAKSFPIIRTLIYTAENKLNDYSVINYKADKLLNELSNENKRNRKLLSLYEDKIKLYDLSANHESLRKIKEITRIESDSEWQSELSGLLNWPEIQEKSEQINGMAGLMFIDVLFKKYENSTDTNSSCWNVLSFKNYNQLLRDGYKNFKRTLGTSYFNFLVQAGDNQISFLEETLSDEVVKNISDISGLMEDDPFFEWEHQETYRYFLLLLWRYTSNRDSDDVLKKVREPLEGNPIFINHDEQNITSDLCNSTLEYYSIKEAIDFKGVKSILEIGGGYGRFAYLMLSLIPDVKYIMIDIPPAIWLSQRYLSSTFKDKKIFRVQDFNVFDEVKVQYEEADIVFLLPHQVKYIPKDTIDLSVNISSFGEMKEEQVSNYFEHIDRVTKYYFYTKQWINSVNYFDRIDIKREKYPVKDSWEELYNRECCVQTEFFEALYKIS